MSCESVAKGSAVEVLFLSSNDTMTMDPRYSEHEQQIITALMGEEKMLAAMEEAERAALEEAVARKSIAKGAAVEVLFLLHNDTMAMEPRDSDHEY